MQTCESCVTGVKAFPISEGECMTKADEKKQVLERLAHLEKITAWLEQLELMRPKNMKKLN
jgi:hypothetical protein